MTPKYLHFPVEKSENNRYTAKQWWILVEDIGWHSMNQRERYYHSVKESLIHKYGIEGFNVFSAYFRAFYNNLQNMIMDYNIMNGTSIPINGGDSAMDNIAHIVGLGKEYYYRIINNLPLVEERYKKRLYVESFAYCFN